MSKIVTVPVAAKIPFSQRQPNTGGMLNANNQPRAVAVPVVRVQGRKPI